MDIVGRSVVPSDFLKVLLLAAVGATVFVPLAVVAGQATDTVTINVSIEQVSEITVTPVQFNFSQSPGTAANFVKLDVQNTGSVNVSNLHVFTDTLDDEAIRPYGQSNTTYWAAGGVLVVRNETLATNYFAGRLEWNETEDVSNMIKTGVTSPVAWGFYRNTSFEYNWLVGNGTSYNSSTNARYCNTSNSQFAIEDERDNGTSFTRTPDATSITNNGNDSTYAYFSVARSSAPLTTACVAVLHDCTKIFIYKYDRRAGFSTCANSNFLQGPVIQPGQIHTVNMSAYVPFGVPASPGQLNTSTITFSAT